MARNVIFLLLALLVGCMLGIFAAHFLIWPPEPPGVDSIEGDLLAPLAEDGRLLARAGAFGLTEEEFRRRWTERLGVRERAAYRGRGGPSAYLDKVLEDKVLAQEAIARGYTDRPEQRIPIAMARDEFVARPLLFEEVRLKAFPEDRLRAWYEENASELEQPARVRARHIVVTPEPFPPGQVVRNTTGDDATTPEEAREKIAYLQDRLEEGVDFEELARKYSEDITAPMGGDLGSFEPGQMLPALEERVFALSEGEVSLPIGTQMGIHLVQVLEKDEGGVPPFDEAKSLVVDRLLEEEPEAVQRRYEAFIEELKGKYPVEILAADEEIQAFDTR